MNERKRETECDRWRQKGVENKLIKEHIMRDENENGIKKITAQQI